MTLEDLSKYTEAELLRFVLTILSKDLPTLTQKDKEELHLINLEIERRMEVEEAK